MTSTAASHDEAANVENRLTNALSDLRKYWPALTKPGSGSEHHGSPSADTITDTDRRISLAHEATLALNGWARVVAEDRGLTHLKRPCIHKVLTTLTWPRVGPTKPRCSAGLPLDAGKHPLLGTDTPGLIDLLERHARWLAGHEAGRDCADELATWAYRVRTTCTGERTSRFRVGNCPEIMWDGNDETMSRCPGELIVTLHHADQLLPKIIACTWHEEHTWAPHEWAALGKRVTAAIEDVATGEAATA